MGKFNVVQKQRRLKIAEHKRVVHGEAGSRKLKTRPQPESLSGKRKRKIFKKWRRDQKEALEKGLVTMEDIEMVVADGTSQDLANGSQGLKKKAPMRIRMKKGGKLRIKKLTKKGKKGGNNSEPAAVAQLDTMVE